MLEKIIYERERKRREKCGILCGKSLVKLLSISFYERFNPIYNANFLVKVGSLFKPLKFELNVNRYILPIDRGIFELDEPQLIADILRIAKRRKVIGDDIYEKVDKALYDFDLNGGVYLIVNNRIPVVRIIDTPQKECSTIYRPVSFELANKTSSGFWEYGSGILKHTPDLESTHSFYRVELELSVDEGIEGSDDLINLYERINRYYEESGFTTVDS